MSAAFGLACAAHLVSCLFSTASAQSPAVDPEWAHPVTPWGEPDLRGRWPIAHMISTSLERPAEYGTRRFMNDEELAKVEASVEARNTRYDEETGNNKMGGGHWAEPTAVVGLTSMIVDDFDSWDRCITRGLPVSMLPRNYNTEWRKVNALQRPASRVSLLLRAK